MKKSIALFLIQIVVFTLVALGLIYAIGAVAEAAVPVMEDALWTAYHMVMG